MAKDIASIDIHFGNYISGNVGGGGEGVFLAAMLASKVTRGGSVCLNLREWAGRDVAIAGDEGYRCPELQQWLEELSGCPAIGTGRGSTPLVLDSGRLYLQRYWEYEDDIAEFIISRSRHPGEMAVDNRLQTLYERLFPNPEGIVDWQGLAALAVLLRSFVVITGGPGTGKTTTIAKIITLMLEHHSADNILRIALAAPTGKAVMRLQGVMAALKMSISCPEAVREQIPTRVVTLHRLLGSRKDSPFFRHDDNKQLPLDLLIVDEASMVDLPMMAKLVRALSPSTRLVLLGDRDQLASVEPGAVLGDICRKESLPRFSRGFLDKAALVTPVDGIPGDGDGLADSLVELQKSHRFGADSGIYLVGQAVKRGDSEQAMELLLDEKYPDVVWREINTVAQLRQSLHDRFSGAPPGWFGVNDPESALQCLGATQILSAVRHGGFGVVKLNGYIEEVLSEKWGVAPGALSYPGRLVMVVENNYQLELYNGDTGIIMGDPAKDAAPPHVVFPTGDGDFRQIPLAMLPDHETAYAMTVHKSQGSEFAEVILVLPDRLSPVLTRELLYTALTRARQRVEVWGRPEIFKKMAGVEISRYGGLRSKLAGEG